MKQRRVRWMRGGNGLKTTKQAGRQAKDPCRQSCFQGKPCLRYLSSRRKPKTIPEFKVAMYIAGGHTASGFQDLI